MKFINLLYGKISNFYFNLFNAVPGQFWVYYNCHLSFSCHTLVIHFVLHNAPSILILYINEFHKNACSHLVFLSNARGFWMLWMNVRKTCKLLEFHLMLNSLFSVYVARSRQMPLVSNLGTNKSSWAKRASKLRGNWLLKEGKGVIYRQCKVANEKTSGGWYRAAN